MRKSFLIEIILLSILFCLNRNLYSSSNDQTTNNNIYYNSVAIKPIDLFLSIYSLQYERQLDAGDEVILGLNYLGNNSGSGYPGTFRLYSLTTGYRRYLWEGLYAEYLLMPSYASYNDTNANIQSGSFEIWNEFHFGYRFELKLFNIPFFITPHVLIGFCLYRSNQPQSFKAADENNFYPNLLYVYPNVSFGVRF